ncbi:unnamed protein product [Prorocentrum cordatum]|uniref:Reverse transcriptase Ty1/copia-type domain-containing protein n=1 Tax=Prorocentrum cordatum TaxID=2364126 RepID=A0ABN9XN31_9DINO|nr:unnamed protein product [Polarella glacialis]
MPQPSLPMAVDAGSTAPARAPGGDAMPMEDARPKRKAETRAEVDFLSAALRELGALEAPDCTARQTTSEWLGCTGGRVFDIGRVDPDDGSSWDCSLPAKQRKEILRQDRVYLGRAKGACWLSNGKELAGRMASFLPGQPADTAVVQGLEAQLRADGRIKPLFACPLEPEEDLHECPSMGDWCDHSTEQYVDDVSGCVLDPTFVKGAREAELREADDFKVYKWAPVEEAAQVTGKKPIGVRWSDANKGDQNNPNYRSRLCAKELKVKDPGKEGTFAATPPLEALRFLCSLMMTAPGGEDAEAQQRGDTLLLLFMDATRAHFHSPTDELIYVEAPPERHRPGRRRRLLKSMRGTRRAGHNWERFYTSVLVERLGFTQGLSSPCVFLHGKRRVRAWVHGDDFAFLGSRADVLWVEEQMRQLIKMKKTGLLEVRCLNRIIRLDTARDCLEWECDPRHAHIAVEQMGLRKVSKGVVTPGASTAVPDPKGDPVLDRSAATLFRSVTMRTAHQSIDRPELLYPAKEAARAMQNPTRSALEKIKRIARYLVSAPRVVQVFHRQPEQSKLIQYTDADHAGCKVTRRSTSAGATMHGSHMLAAYSTTQKPIATSSGESEDYGMFKAGSRHVGMALMAKDYGLTCKAELRADASAGVGIASRRGIGKIRHLHTQALWLQQAVAEKRLSVSKTKGESNPANLPTKHGDGKTMWQHLADLGFELRSGQSKLAIERKSGVVNEVLSDDADDMKDSAIAVTDEAPPWFKEYEARQKRQLNMRFDRLHEKMGTKKGVIKEVREDVEDLKETMRNVDERIDGMAMDVTNLKADMDMFVTADSMKNEVEELVKKAMADFSCIHRGAWGQGVGGANTNKGNNAIDSDMDRAMQAVAFGFKERQPAVNIEETLETALKVLLGEVHAASASAFTEEAKMGVITFRNIHDKIEFYKAARACTDKSMPGGMFFRNSLATEEREKEKRLRRTKHHIINDGGGDDGDAKILWRRDMVTVKGEKVAWYDEEGEWHVKTVAKKVEANIDESMKKWRSKTDPEPVTDID